MYNIAKLEHIREYSDDEIAFQAPSESDLDDIEAYDKSIHTYQNGSPNNDMTKLGNPYRHINEESSNYSIDYYYSDANNIETFHIFRTLKPDKNKNEKDGKDYFPSIEYMESIQKLQGISLMKLVEFSESEKWVHFEYVPGGTLYDSLKFGRQFNGGDKYKILYGIAITMNSLHEKGIIHLDIRLESIVVTISENRPVLADVDMMVHQYTNSESYDDQFLPYLDPYFEDVDGSVRADIYSFGIMMNLFILKNTQVLEKSNIETIKKAIKEFKNSDIKDEDQKLTKYLNTIGIELNRESSEEMEKNLMKISRDCLFGQIKTSSDLLSNLIDIIPPESYIKGANNVLSQELILTEEETNNRDFSSEKFNFERSTLPIVEQSASNLNAKDIWLVNKRDEIKGRSIQQRAAEASLYATITGDFSLYEQILREEPGSNK